MGKTEVTVDQWNKLQPAPLKKDGNFSLPNDIEQTLAFLQETVKDSKNRPKELRLNPKERVYNVEVLEKIVEVIQKGSLRSGMPPAVWVWCRRALRPTVVVCCIRSQGPALQISLALSSRVGSVEHARVQPAHLGCAMDGGTVHRKVNEIMEKKGLPCLEMPMNRTRKSM